MTRTDKHPSGDQRVARISVVVAALFSLVLLVSLMKGCSQSTPMAPGDPARPQPVASAGPR